MLSEDSEIANELLDNSPDAMLALSPEGTVVYWNKGAENTFGFSRDEAIGRELSELIIPADRIEEEEKFFDEVIKSGHSTFESLRKSKDGSLIPVDIATRVIRDDRGRVKYILSSKKDITERKLAEEALQGSELRYRRLFESAKDGILILDGDSGQIVDVNPYLIDLLNISKAELAGKELWEIGPFKDIVASKLAFAELKERGYIRYDDLPLQSSVGVIRHLEVVSNSYLAGESRVIQCNVRDITERNLAEAALGASEGRYRTLFEYAPDGIVVADPESYYVDANASMCRMLGYTRDELIGLHASDIVTPTEIQHIGPALGVINSNSDHHREWQFRRKDGSFFAAEVVATMMPDGNLLGMVRDITERRLAEEELLRTNQSLKGVVAELQTKTQELASMTQQLWQASKLTTMGELAASVAHELNNPLATISLHAEAIVGRLAADDPNRPSLQVIEQEVERMASLVSNLLLFSRRGHQQISTVDFCEELTRSLDFIQYHLRSHDIEIVNDCATVLPTVEADRQQLHQVFLNLISNASDAMPKGGTLTVRSRVGAMAGGHPAVVVEFSDTGTGVQTGDLPKLWEPFFTTKPEGKGTGLGLSICRRIVEEHRGTIEIETGPGKGTTVRITFPATDEATEVAA
jgi:two-component system, LuxR family, sensor kinase FixL